jgi:hypothetical protein
VDIPSGQALSFKFLPNPDATNFDATPLVWDDVYVNGWAAGSNACAAGKDFSALVTQTQIDVTPCVQNSRSFASTTSYTVTFGSSTSATKTMILNPEPVSGIAANYMIELYSTDGVNPPQQTRIRVALVENVDVTAQVDPIFDFTVSGIASTTSTTYGAITTDSSTSTINYGILPVGTAQTAAQGLQVKTNARQGFNVTVVSDQPFESQNGAIIDGVPASGSPVVWPAIPANVNDDTTWGYIGLSSDDATVNGISFAGQAYTGQFVRGTATSIFSNASSTAGVGQGLGTTTVYYRTEISPLQEAATDYHMNLIYVATPTF